MIYGQEVFKFLEDWYLPANLDQLKAPSHDLG